MARHLNLTTRATSIDRRMKPTAAVKTQIGMQKILQIMRKIPIVTQRMMPIAITRTPIAMQRMKAHPTAITERMSSSNEHSRSSTGASEGSEGRSEHRGSIANVTSEQKTRIRTVFSRHHVEPARNLNVSVNVGVALPRSVHLYPVPEDIVLIVPDYRGYDYIMLDDNRVAIVDPETYEIVDIIEIA